MKTREILTADEKTVSTALKGMKIKTLERHAQKILGQLGQDNYDAVMAAVIKIVPQLTRETGGDRFTIVQNVITEQLPVVSSDSPKSDNAKQEVLVRLTVVVMVIIAKKFTKIMKEGV